MDIEEAKIYLRLDSDYEDEYIEELINVSDIYITSMVGDGYKQDVKAVKMANLLMKKLIVDLYENRGMEIPTTTKKDIIVTSILDKLSNY